MDQTDFHNYLQFCQDYQRQMGQIINTYTQMNERLNYYYFQRNTLQTPINIPYTSEQSSSNNNTQTPNNNSFNYRQGIPQTYYLTSPLQTRRYRNTTINDIFGSVFTNLMNTPQEDVIVRPSDEQIENATQIIRYDTIDNPTHDSCPIDLTPFNGNSYVMQIKHCKHIFHSNNLRLWFNNSVRCPMCRYDIRDYNSDNNSTDEQTTTEE